MRGMGKHTKVESTELDALVHSAFEKNKEKIVKKVHGSHILNTGVQSELIALENKAEGVRIVMERTVEGADVPVEYDLDYTVRCEFVDMGVVLAIDNYLDNGLLPHVYVRKASFAPVAAFVSVDAHKRVLRYLKGAEVVAYKADLDDHDEEEVPMDDMGIPEEDVIIDEGPEGEVGEVVSEGAEEGKENV